MKLKNSSLVIKQLDKKLETFSGLKVLDQPSSGWIKLIRTILNMSLSQLGKKMQMTPQGVRAIENREREGTLTLNALQDAAHALEMKLVYGFIPNDGSLEKMIERKAYEVAEKIVERTSATMKLEAQENSEERIKQAVKELAEDIKREMPRKLWD
jgi:predicted DNA-binding mobile mystery protein A